MNPLKNLFPYKIMKHIKQDDDVQTRDEETNLTPLMSVHRTEHNSQRGCSDDMTVLLNRLQLKCLCLTSAELE